MEEAGAMVCDNMRRDYSNARDNNDDSNVRDNSAHDNDGRVDDVWVAAADAAG